MLHVHILRGFCFLISAVLLAACGPKPNLSPASSVAEAARQLSVYNFEAARKELLPVHPKLAPSDPDWEMATYLYAQACWHSLPASADNIAKAQKLLETLIAEKPAGKTAPWALTALARLQEVPNYPGDPVDLPAAKANYLRVLEQYPGSTAADTAAARLGGILFSDLNNPAQRREGCRIIEDRLAKYPDSPQANALHEILSDFYLQENETGKALEHLEAASRLGFTNPSRTSEYYFLMAQLAEKSGQVKKAVDLYTYSILKIPRNNRAWQSVQRLEALKKGNPGMPITVPAVPDFALKRKETAAATP